MTSEQTTSYDISKNYDTRSSRRVLMRGATRLVAGSALALSGLSMYRPRALAQDGSPAAGAGIDRYPEVVYTAAEYQFTGPAEFPAGLTRITLQNDGAMLHHAMLFKLNDGKSFADLPAALAGGLGGLLAIGASLGGPGSIDPGLRSTVIHDVPAGNYILMCVIPDTDGVPHVAKGMALAVTVTAGDATASPPRAGGSLKLEEFLFSGLPASVPAGQQVWEVTVTGQQLHELLVCRNAPGVTFADVEAIFSLASATPEATMAGMDDGTPMTETSPAATAGAPFAQIGGLAPASPGMGGWAVFDLEAGDYFAICHLPDPASGAPHFALGMIQPFTVA